MPDARDSGGIFSAGGKPILDAAGEFQGYLGTIKKVQEAPAPTGTGIPDLELFTAFEAMPHAIAKFGADDRLVACNQLYRNMQALPAELTAPGMEFEQILRACVERRLIFDAIGREDEFLEQRMQAHRHPGNPVVFQLNKGHWLESYEKKTADGGTICIDRNITAQRLAGEEHAIVEAHHVTALDAGNLGVWVWEIDSGEVVVAPNFPSMLGYSNGGKLTITTENCLPSDPVNAAGGKSSRREYVRLSVTDTGEGMTPETQEQAFEPFFTTKRMAQHSGLGFSMVHGFVSQSGGYVIIDSKPSEGTTVTVYLPRV